MERHAVSRLIGAPPGYVGFDQGGLLTEAVTKKPHSVLLLDEIEKAHPDVFNILLQVMDHGTLTDNNGRKADFRNVIIIMTTNAGAESLQKRTMGFTESKQAGDEMIDIKRMFTPEFRNRLDAIISFKALDEEIILRVVELLFGKLMSGGRVTVDLDDQDNVKLDFAESDTPPPAAPQETVEVE
jgi:ATP-dependent Clp protease ATP-binding subunit ClpA